MIEPSVVSRWFWRILSPRWSRAPLSGAGGARGGGRWNQPGDVALYMSETIETAFAEYQQEWGVRPGTFVAYQASNARIADPTESREWPIEDMVAPWKEAAFVEKAVPVTWRIADTQRGIVDGLRVPSARYPGGVNVVLWRWNGSGAPKVEVLDPNRELP